MLGSATEAAHTSLGGAISEAIPLKSIVILGMFRELAKWVARSRALRPAEERHDWRIKMTSKR